MGFSPWALRNVLDNFQRVTHSGLTVFLRIANADVEDQEFVTYGFQMAVSGSDLGGVTDVEIEPPPDVRALSERDIGFEGTTLKAGAHSFLISHSWVEDRMEQTGATDPYEVFRAGNVIGIVYNQRVFSIEQVVPEEVHNETISWKISGNMREQL